LPRSKTFQLRLPRRRDREMLENLRTVAAEHEMSTSAMARWIFNQVLLGNHPARVRARLLTTRHPTVEPLPTPTPVAPPPAPLAPPLAGPSAIAERRPHDELRAIEEARERRRARRRLS
jgi:hypothetical protein